MKTKLSDNEVREVSLMQMKIDTYESFISAIHAMILRKDTNLNYLLFDDTPLTKEMNNVWHYIKDEINADKKRSETT